MKRLAAITAAVAATLAACSGGSAPETVCTPFTDEVRLAVTPVKDQGRSELCWIYAMLATIETDRIGMDDSVHLSHDFAARAWMADRTTHCHLSQDGQGVSMRAMGTTLFTILERYGITTYDSYNSRPAADYTSLARQMTRMAARRLTLDALQRSADMVMDTAIGALPRHVYMAGAEYSMLQFANSVARRSDYQAITSFTHHPWGSTFALETADNVTGDTFLNVPIDSLMGRIEHALRHGRAVCWEGDVSEDGFSFERGTALTDDERPCTQQQRQHQFETLETTDDHCMAIIGMAHDRQGRRFFIAKNSWGTDNPYGGMVYMSENYVRLKTIAIITRRDT